MRFREYGEHAVHVHLLICLGAHRTQLPRPCLSCPRSPSKTDIADTFRITINPLTLSERIASRDWRVSSALALAAALPKASAREVLQIHRLATSIRIISHRCSVKGALLVALLPPVA